MKIKYKSRKEKEKKSIGVFDSGVGGLVILKGLLEEIPEYNYIYLADSKNFPYGNKTQKEIYNLTEKAVDFLFKKNCELIILACNTISSRALRKIQRRFLVKNHPKKRVLGVIIPAVEEIKPKKDIQKIGIIATKSTVKSKAFLREIRKINPKAVVFQKACPKLVSIAENRENPEKELKKCLSPLLKKNIDFLILGCTHYELLKEEIKKIIDKKTKIISEKEIVPKKLKTYLIRHTEIEKELGKEKKLTVYATGKPEKFKKSFEKILRKKVKVLKAEI